MFFYKFIMGGGGGGGWWLKVAIFKILGTHGP
jgi:hypothetical protein